MNSSMLDPVRREVVLSLNLNHDSSAALFVEGRLIAAISEERLNRKKNSRSFPSLSIAEVLRMATVAPQDISYVLLGSKISPNLISMCVSTYHGNASEDMFHWLYPLVVMEQSLFRKSGLINVEGAAVRSLVKKYLRRLSIDAPIIMFEHHVSHAYSAYGACGNDDVLIVSMDCMGDGLSAFAGHGKNGRVIPLEVHEGFESIGFIYAQMTQLLGYTPGRHEGKLTGLAAYGDPFKTEPLFRDLMWYSKGRMRAKHVGFKSHPLLHRIARNSPEDVAAGLQYVFEDVISQYVIDMLKKNGLNALALAGGVFANVKLNQRIYERTGAKRIFVYPNMGDGGLAVGAGYAFLKSPPSHLENVYLGVDYDAVAIEAALKRAHLTWERVQDVEYQVARLLAAGNVVGRFAGRAEFGPRALGNRSILCRANDKSVNVWLNKKMRRTEFMPFAPATNEEHAHEYYQNIDGASDAARFMTITFDCTQKSRERQEACVHKDNTARPQIVRYRDNPSFHDIIRHYYNLTSVASIINTSFNVHEEPIVNSPDDAVRSFLECELDVLAIENYIVHNPTRMNSRP